MPNPHSKALRKGRLSQPGCNYHLRTSTAANYPFFKDLRLGRIVVSSMRYIHQRGDVESLAFVVMPDHLHWLIRLEGVNDLDAIVKSLKGYSARRINSQLQRTGTVWQNGYFDRAIRAEDDLKTAARYIIANPLRAKLCSQIGNYSLWDAAWL